MIGCLPAFITCHNSVEYKCLKMISMDEAPLVLKSVLFLSGIMTGLKMLSALNIGISGKRLDMLSIECPD
jgi:hypothetical protein